MSNGNRRMVARSAAALVLVLVLVPAHAWGQEHRHHEHHRHDHAATASAQHPEPRPHVGAEDVVHPADGGAEVAEVYRMASAIPRVLDGIRCPCGCGAREGHYSLLSCFGEDGLASDCGVCRRAAGLAYRLHREGSDLDAIRAAVDAAFGGRGGT